MELRVLFIRIFCLFVKNLRVFGEFPKVVEYGE